MEVARVEELFDACRIGWHAASCLRLVELGKPFFLLPCLA